jgi:large subunit ribosomal protein L30
MTTKKLNVTLVKSKIGRLADHKSCLKGLGLRKIRQTVQVAATSENLGMISKISYMVSVEEA